MKKILALCSFAAIVVLFAQCASKKAATSTTMSDKEKVAEINKNFSDDQIANGKELWQSNCNKCHKLYTPESHSIAKWENVLPRMTKRAKLDDAQAANVRAYLISNAKS